MRLTPVRLLLLLTVLLGAALFSLWMDRQGHWRNITWAVPATKVPDIKAPVDLVSGANNAAAASFASIQERPMFAPDRRPPPPPLPPPPPDPFASVQVKGIFTGTTTGILASVEGKVKRIKINESIGAWALKKIDGRQITFTQGEQTRQLQLAYSTLNTVVPPPPKLIAPVPGGPPGAQTAVDHQAAYREELARRNAFRASRGLPLLAK